MVDMFKPIIMFVREKCKQRNGKCDISFVYKELVDINLKKHDKTILITNHLLHILIYFIIIIIINF